MDVSPAITEVGDQIPPAEVTVKDEDEEDLCRICRSPEESGNPLRYPCLCRGSIKYVHEDCLRLWLNRRGSKKCEVCGLSYSFVPLYSENAPERLPCNEFLIGLLLRISRCMKLLTPWVLAFLFNTFCFSLHPWGQLVVADFQGESEMSRKFASLPAGLIYNGVFFLFMMGISIIRVEVENHNVRRLPGGVPAENFIGNDLRQGALRGVVQVLWKYMKILCDWYYLKLIHPMGQPPELLFVPQNVPLHEFGVIRRLFFFLDDNTFAALAICVYVPILIVLLPFSIGWIVLATVGGSYLSEKSPVILGYTMILAMSFAYFLSTVCPVSFQAVVRWFSLGLHFITVNLPCLLWKFSVEACKNLWWFPLGFHFITVILPCHLWNFLVIVCKNLFVIKDAFVFCLKIGVLPWMIGWWLEICISPLFGSTMSQRFEIPSGFPQVSIHWMLGIFCLLEAYCNMHLIQQIIHRRAFWYLLDVTDPDYNITELNIGYTFFAFACNGVLLVILFHLPLKAITLISPSFFPLRLWVNDEKPFRYTHVIYVKLMLSGPSWLIKHMKPAIKLIVHNWIITVSSWLQLSNFLLVVPRGEGFHRADQDGRPLMQPRRELDSYRWFQFCIMAEGSMVILTKSQNAEEDMQDKRDNSFKFLPRIQLMLVLAALSLFLCGTAFMALPILLGRVLFGSVSFIILGYGVTHDDFCGFWIGCYILQAICISTCYVSDHIQKGQINLLIRFVWIEIRSCLFFSIWIFVIPGLLGLLIDLMIIIPLRVPLNESPVYFLIQDWLIGVLVLHIWTFMTMFTPINWFATEAWRRKLERIKNDDRVSSTWLLRDVIVCIIDTLLTILCIPYLLVKCLFPLLGLSQSIVSVVERLIWPALLALITVWFMVKLTRHFIIYLHQLVFNERYLVGERVDNLTEDREQRRIGGV